MDYQKQAKAILEKYQQQTTLDSDIDIGKLDIALLIDHTLLKPQATYNDVMELLKQATDNSFFSVCIYPCWIDTAKNFLNSSSVKVCTVVGFPHGSSSIKSKIEEIKSSIDTGADEIDMVLNFSFLKSGLYKKVLQELQNCASLCKGRVVLKVILETCYLTKEEIIVASLMCMEARVDFIKTSTGFGSEGATVDNVRLMSFVTKGHLKVKASGGVGNLNDFTAMVRAGASRIGTSSGVKIVNEQKITD